MTRTTAGREGVRQEIEDRFRSRLSGSIQIGRLSGNLVYSFLAENVSLFDPDGKLIGHIDTVRAEPSWESLVTRELRFKSIELRGVVFDVERDSEDNWNVVESIRPRAPSDSARSPFSLIAPDIRLARASIVVRNRGSIPAAVRSGILTDYLNESITIDRSHFVLDWEGTTRQLDVVNLTADLPERNIAIRRLQSQVVWEDDVTYVNEFSLTTSESRIELTGSYESAGSDSTSTNPFDIDLRAVPLASRELVSIFPVVSARDAVVLETHMSGDRNSIVVNNASIARGESAVQAAGVFDIRNDSLLTDLGISSPHFSLKDLIAVFPSINAGQFTAVDSAKGEIWIQSGSRLASAGNVIAAVQADIESSAGAVSTTGTVSFQNGVPIAYAGTAAMADVNLLSISAGRLPASLLSGNLDIDLQGRSLDNLTGRASIFLGASSLSRFDIDTLSTTMEAASGLLSLSGIYSQPRGGRASVTGQYRNANAEPSFSASLRGSAFDLFGGRDMDGLASSFNGQVEFTGGGNSLADLHGQLSIVADSSAMMRRGFNPSTLVPFDEQLTLSQNETDGARLTLSGTVATGAFETELTLLELSRTSAKWSELLSGYFSQLANKRFADREKIALVADSVLGRAAPTSRSFSAQQTRLAFSLDVTDPSVLAALVFTNAAGRNCSIKGSGTVSDESFLISWRVTADSIRIDSFVAESLASTITVSANANQFVSRSFSVDGTARAGQTTIGQQTLVDPVFSVRHREGTGTYRLQSAEGRRVGPIDVRAQLTTLGTSNRLIVDAAKLVAGEYNIGVTTPNYIDLYSDAIVARKFELFSSASDGQRQRLEFDGTYSANPTDTLHVVSENIELEQLSEFLALRNPIGGTVNGRAVVTKQDNLPVVSGDASITTLSLGPRVLGDLELNADLLPGTSNVSMNASLHPIPDSASVVLGKIVVNNRLRASGTVGFADARLGPALDLDVKVDRADLFFFEYIFPHTIEGVHGLVEGTGTITGNWFDPRFDASLRIVDGSFSVPDFNLAYTIEGGVSVDDRGVHIGAGQLVDNSGGSATIGGSVLFNDFKFFSLDLEALLSDLQVMNVDQSEDLPFFGHISASGDVSLSGPLSNASLRSINAETTSSSILNIPLVSATTASDAAFIVFADSSGTVGTESKKRVRRNVLSKRPVGERTFLDGLAIDLNLFGPPGSTVNLVIDPLLGDVMKAVGTGRVQIIRTEGEFTTFGTFEVNSGDYLFTAGDVFVRRFALDSGGSLTWDGNPTNAILDVPASYQTRASSAGLPGAETQSGTIPLIVRLEITGRVATPEVELSLEVDRTNRNVSGSYQALEAILNQPARATEYATSVLVTNSFLLTTSDANSNALASSAFNSVSQLVASQINRYLNEALPNVDFSFGVQGESAQELGVTYGIALSLLDERLVIRGRGVYQGSRTDAPTSANGQGLEGEFVVELRLSEKVSVEAFYRREGDVLTESATTTGSTGAGVSYHTEFSSWRRFFRRLFGIHENSSDATASSDFN